MACMEHQCDTCGEMWFDNKASGTCSKCGSYDVASFYDEANYDEPDRVEVEEE